MANNLVTNKTNELSVNGARELVTNIQNGLALVSKGYLMIAPDVQKLYDCKGYKALGYKNFDEMCALEFGMSHGTAVGIRKVFDKFGTVTKENKYLIPEKYLEYGYTKLLLMTDKKFEENGINPIETFTPDMTINDMKDALKLKLEEKAEKQDTEAIDTTATDVINEEFAEEVAEVDEHEQKMEEIEKIAEENGYAPDPFKFPVLDQFGYAIELVKVLKETSTSNGMKSEKLAYFDAIIANLNDAIKEYKKLKK